MFRTTTAVLVALAFVSTVQAGEQVGVLPPLRNFGFHVQKYVAEPGEVRFVKEGELIHVCVEARNGQEAKRFVIARYKGTWFTLPISRRRVSYSVCGDPISCSFEGRIEITPRRPSPEKPPAGQRPSPLVPVPDEEEHEDHDHPAEIEKPPRSTVDAKSVRRRRGTSGILSIYTRGRVGNVAGF